MPRVCAQLSHRRSSNRKSRLPLGLLKDISASYGFDADYAFSPHVNVFAVYCRKRYYTRRIARYRTPTAGVQVILTCTGCDTPNNDWQSTTPDPVDI